ncbi:MAG: hypothetical protein A2519_19400, partial [Candidatus Raymondbacteria bacterium RIFOXYD12_FULL_49_13]
MSRSAIYTAFFLLILIAITAAFFRTIEPFILDIIVAAILAHMFSPLHIWLKKALVKHHRIAAGLTVAAAFFIVFLPVVLLGTLITREAAGFFVFLSGKAADLSKTVEHVLAMPLINEYRSAFDFINLREKLQSIMESFGSITVSLIQNAFVNIYEIVFNFFIVLILLFFLLVDGETLFVKIRNLLPLRREDQVILVSRFNAITDATIKGTIIIGIVEGTVGASLMAIFGFPSPVVWGLVMALLSMVPILGTNTVLVPAALFRIFTGQYASGIAILVLGVGFVLISQYFIKPRVLGSRSGLHEALILLSTIGGIMWLGLIGFLIG